MSVFIITRKVMNGISNLYIGRAFSKEVIKFFERSGSYVGILKIPNFQKHPLRPTFVDMPLYVMLHICPLEDEYIFLSFNNTSDLF